MTTSNEFICLVYEILRETGKWPRVAELQVKLRRSGSVRRIAAEAGFENVVCQEMPDGECYLTLKGLARCPSAAADVENYLALVRILAAKYVASGACRVTSDELRRELELSDMSLRRLYEVVHRGNGIWIGHGQSNEGPQCYFDPTDTIVFFENVNSLDRYWEVFLQIEEERRQANLIMSGPALGNAPALAVKSPPSQLSSRSVALSDAKIQDLVRSDLRELEQVLQIGAWKSVAFIAGSCTEAILLDMWKCREDLAMSCFGKKWPDKVNASELAVEAAKQGFLARDHHELMAPLRRWRNVIHPAAALRDGAPSREIALALVAVLELLLADVARGNRAETD